MSDYRDDPRWQDAVRRADQREGETAADRYAFGVDAVMDMYAIELEHEAAS